MQAPALSWDDTGLEPRLLRALAKRGFPVPTAVQAAAVPRCLEGKDVLARARTGSGKTLAYLLPALHCLLAAAPAEQASAAAAASLGSFQVLVLVPTRELCEQVKQEAALIVQHCGAEITVSALFGENNQQLKRAVALSGNVVVATPGKVASALREGFLPPGALAARLRFLVLDEADLLLSYGYEEDLQLLAPLVPRSCQCILMSATSSSDVERLQALVLHNPLALNLLDAGATAGGGAGADGGAGLSTGLGLPTQIQHYSVDCAKGDRLLHVMAMLKLGLVRKKVLLFVNTVDEAFRLKLFLESFGISSALLNAELPLNSRSHILETFNRGLFDYLIATDDVHASAHDAAKVEAVPLKKRRGRQPAVAEAARPAKRARKDEEFGVTRGIDFKGVHTIVNYDLPSSVQGYVHRVGRTGRAGEAGVAISLFTPADAALREEVADALDDAAGAAPSTAGEGADEDIDDAQPGTSGRGDEDEEGSKQALRPFRRLSKVQVEALRYRGEDLARSITRHIIKEARARELKAELLNSSKLKDYFEGHSAEQKLLRHDKPLHKQAPAPHLRHVPGYLKDPAMLSKAAASGVGNFKPKAPVPKERRKGKKAAGAFDKSLAADPLKAVIGAANTLPVTVYKGFTKAPKKGADGHDDLTELEIRATKKGKKQARDRVKAAGGAKPAAVFKQNVKRSRAIRGK